MTACVLDTDVVIAALDRSDSQHWRSVKGFQAALAAGTRLEFSLVNYAEALVRPAQDEPTLRIAVEAIAALRIGLVAPTPAIAREAARLRSLNISLADGFALATAAARGASVATFDRRVLRAMRRSGIDGPGVF